MIKFSKILPVMACLGMVANIGLNKIRDRRQDINPSIR